MILTDARYDRLDGYPVLRLKVNGRPALLIAECKPTVHAAGLVFLGDEFDDILPRVTLNRTELRGFSSDRRLFALYDAFGRACGDGTFRPGPVPIPD